MRAFLTKLSPVSRVLIFSTVLALFLRGFILEIYRIRSDSMFPTLPKNTLVIASRAHYNVFMPFTSFSLFNVQPPARAEIVAFSLPDSAATTFVKRIVAIGGDRLQIQKGRLSVNDTELGYVSTENDKVFQEQVSPAAQYEIVIDTSQDYGPIDVPDGHFFALGDNRENSVDSRDWGPIPYRYLKGRIAQLWGF